MISTNHEHDWIVRYSRQLILKNWNSEKQQHLGKLTVAVPPELKALPLYLAAAGVGKLVYTGKTPLIKHLIGFNSLVQISDSGDLDVIDIAILPIIAKQEFPSIEINKVGDETHIAVSYHREHDLLASTIAACAVISIVEQSN